MQTFLPYEDFVGSARVLGRQRLGKQRVENLQIMTALLEGRGWIHHPAVKMWEGFELALLRYQEAICEEWTRRGYRDSCLEKTYLLYEEHRGGQRYLRRPGWLGLEDLHLSHQSNLVRKDAEFYGPIFRGVPDDIPYYWPV